MESSNDSVTSRHLCAEAVERLALALERVDHIKGGHGLAAGMLSVGDRVADNVLKEGLEDTAGLFVHHSGDALDSTTTGKTTDGRLGDSLDVVTQHLAVTFGAAFSKAFTTFTTTGHDENKKLSTMEVVLIYINFSCP